MTSQVEFAMQHQLDDITVLNMEIIYTVSQKNVPTFKLCNFLKILTDFQNFCTAGKRMKFATKPI